MMTFSKTARTAKDGTLSVAIPTGIPDSEVNVVVVVDTPSALTDEWPEAYFADTFGSIAEADLQRPPQGVLEERLPL